MITADHVTKTFDGNTALAEMSCAIPRGCVYGLVGSNGAGKSTFLRLVTGIYQPDRGRVAVEDQPVFENPVVKQRMAFVPDDLWFLPQANMQRMAEFYATHYHRFDQGRFRSLTGAFGLDPRANLNTFSKGMRRQAAILLTLSTLADYLFFDETFDGLDPVMRSFVKKILYADMAERGATVVVTSHSLRELEDTCDQLALLHRGRILFESDIQNLKTSLFKVQTAFAFEYDAQLFADIEMVQFSKKGSVASFIARGDRERVAASVRAKNPTLLEILPLSLEEVFVHEMEALGYAFDESVLDRGEQL